MIEPRRDHNAGGLIAAVAFRARRSGTASSIHLYLGAGNRARTLLAGLYSSRDGRPRSRLTSGKLQSPKPRAWNSVAVKAVKLRSGRTYWLAILGDGGPIHLRGSNRAVCTSEGSFTARRQSLPARWHGRAKSHVCLISAYVRGAARSTYAAGPSASATKVSDPKPAAGTTATPVGTTGSTSTSTRPSTGAAPILPPAAITAPQIHGSTVVGATLAAANGTWIDAPTSFAYRWQDCENLGLTCTDISGATSSSYVLRTADVDHTVRLVITGTNAAGSSSAVSPLTAPVSLPSAPANTAGPAISGQATEGQDLNAGHGSWTNDPASYAYQWEECDSSGASCASITGATLSSYALGAADVGHTLRVLVTATNVGGSTSASSAQTAVVTAASPATSVLFGDQNLANYADNDPAGMAQAFSYTAAASGTASTIEVYVNAGATATGLIAGLYSDSGGKPGGLLTTGSLATPQPGAWNVVPVSSANITQGTSYWIAVLGTGGVLNYLDSSSGPGASYVDAATGLSSLPATYSPGAEYNVSPASAYVTGVPSGGAGSGGGGGGGGGGSGSAPQNTAQPYFAPSTVDASDNCTAGCAIAGQQLSVTPGTWTNSPTGYTYQWQDCTITNGQPPITGSCSNASGAGATSATYTVGPADVGKALAVTVTATNGAGSTSTTLAGSCDQGEGYVMWLATSPAFPAGCSPVSAVVSTTNAGETQCTNAITTCGYPDPANQSVGVPAGTTLSPYSGPSNITTAGTVINGAEFTSPITISASNVTIENSDFDENWAQTSSSGAINVAGGVTGTVIKYDSFHGVDDTATGIMFAAVYSASNYSAGTNHVTVDHVYFYDGMRILHGPGTVRNSYCISNKPSSGSHMECIYEGGGSTTIDHTSLLQVGPLIPCGSGSPCAGPIYLSTDFANEGTETVTNNLLAGGNFTIYGGAPGSGYTAGPMTFTGNRFSQMYYTGCGAFGPAAYLPASYTWSGNIYDDTGAAVAP